MTPKEEERKKVFAEILNELFEQYDQYKGKAEIKQKELDELNQQGRDLIKKITAFKMFYDELVPESAEIRKTPINVLGSLLGEGGYIITKPVSVVEALKIIFKAKPSKEFEPVELKDELELIRKKKLLDSDADNLLWITHSALRTLIKDNYLIKNTEGSKPTYRKKELYDLEFIKKLLAPIGYNDEK
jgi:hypothetical protein